MRVVPPVPAGYDALAMYHSGDYLDFILDSKNSTAVSTHAEGSRHAEYGIEEVCAREANATQSLRVS